MLRVRIPSEVPEFLLRVLFVMNLLRIALRLATHLGGDFGFIKSDGGFIDAKSEGYGTADELAQESMLQELGFYDFLKKVGDHPAFADIKSFKDLAKITNDRKKRKVLDYIIDNTQLDEITIVNYKKDPVGSYTKDFNAISAWNQTGGEVIVGVDKWNMSNLSAVQDYLKSNSNIKNVKFQEYSSGNISESQPAGNVIRFTKPFQIWVEQKFRYTSTGIMKLC